MENVRVGIVGAGLTGLIAARVLSSKNVQVVLFEKQSIPGGRMITEDHNGWKLDVGFQVLLSAYPILKRYVNWDTLGVQKLDAAATVFKNNKLTVVGDPFRTKGVLLKTIISSVGSIRDKYLIFKLKKYVDKLNVVSIFDLTSLPTHTFLSDFGFSDKIIDCFFRPFFGGIFLENELSTSHRMFLFVFKMFADGYALIPKEGIGELGKQLASNMSNVEFNYNTIVGNIDVSNCSLMLENGTDYKFDYIINTIPNYGEYKNENKWQGCYNLYFEHNAPAILEEVRIGLNANKGRLINNLFYPSSIQIPADKNGKCLLSITVLDAQGFSEKELVVRVEQELIEDFELNERELKLIKVYSLPYSLPVLDEPRYNIYPKYKNDNVFHVGDFCANGSQNAACAIGESVANEIVKRIEEKS